MIEEWKSWPTFNIWLIDQDTQQKTLAISAPNKARRHAEECARRICEIEEIKWLSRKPFRYLVEEVK